MGGGVVGCARQQSGVPAQCQLQGLRYCSPAAWHTMLALGADNHQDIASSSIGGRACCRLASVGTR
jgi:hypothetical protein